MKESPAIELLNVSELKPHEQVVFLRALVLFLRIRLAGVFTTPILVDRSTGVVLDGHHRLWVSRQLGFRLIPAYCIDYLNDEQVLCEPRRKDIPVSKELVIALASRGGVFPPKTTRHRYELPPSSHYEFRELV